MDIRTLPSIETDEKGVQNAQKQLRDVVKSQIELTESFKRGEKDAAQFNQEMAKLVREEKGLADAIEKATGALAAQAKAEADAAKEAKKFADAQREAAKAAKEAAEEAERLAQANSAQGRFDATSQKVALAGDFESNLRTVGGAAGALGGQFGGKLEQGIGGVAEIGALIEAIPRLKEAAAGLPGAINAAGAAIGTSGAGFIGVLGIAAIAIGAVALAFKKFTDDAKKQAEELAGIIQTRRDIATDIGSGRTAADVEQQITTDKKVLVEQQKLLNDLEASYNDLNVALRQTEQGKALKAELDAQRTLVRDLSDDIDQYSRALADGKFAQEDATEAIEQQVTAQKELSNAVNATAKSATQASQEMQRAAREMSSQSAGFNRRRADSARNRSAGTLGFGFLLGQNKQADSEAEKAQKEAEDKQREFNDKLREIEQDARDKRIDQEINHQRTLEDVVRNFGDNRVDALAEQNFLALDKLNTEERRAKRDLAIDNKRANQDITRETRRANDRLMQEARQYQESRLRMEQQALQQSLNNVNSWANALLSITARLNSRTGSRSGSLFTTQPRTL